MRYLCSLLLFVAFMSAISSAQDQPKQEEPKDQPKAEAPKFVPPIARIRAAKTVFVRNAKDSNEIPYNVIQSGIDTWGRFIPAVSAEKADIIIEITAPEEPNNLDDPSGSGKAKDDDKKKASQDAYVNSVKLTVLDPRSGLPLWNAIERPKGGIKKAAREENLIKTAQELFRRFRILVDPQSAQQDQAQ